MLPCTFTDPTRSAVHGETEANAVSKDRAWKQVKADWRDVVLVCRKCSKKLDGGFGPQHDKTLAKVLRRALARPDDAASRKTRPRRREIAVLEVGCLDICPKKAVVMVKCSDLKSMILVLKGADMDEVLDRLRLQIAYKSEAIKLRGADVIVVSSEDGTAPQQSY